MKIYYRFNCNDLKLTSNNLHSFDNLEDLIFFLIDYALKNLNLTLKLSDFTFEYYNYDYIIEKDTFVVRVFTYPVGYFYFR